MLLKNKAFCSQVLDLFKDRALIYLINADSWNASLVIVSGVLYREFTVLDANSVLVPLFHLGSFSYTSQPLSVALPYPESCFIGD